MSAGIIFCRAARWPAYVPIDLNVIQGVSLMGAQPNDVADQIMRAELPTGGRSVLPHIRPAHGETVRRSNVDFHWPTREEFNQATGDTKQWQGTVRNAAGTTVHTFNSAAGYNHHAITTDLPPGEYEWDLYDPGLPGGTAGYLVQARRFTVHPEATHFDTPTRDAAYAQALANSARTCIPPSVTQYQAGGVRRGNYDRMVVAYNAFKAPTALTAYGSFGAEQAENERTRAYILAYLHAVNGGGANEYQTEGLRRLLDPTAGILYIDPTGTSGLTFSNENVYRPWLEAVAVLARQFWGAMSAPQRVDVLTALGRRFAFAFDPANPYTRLISPDGSASTANGRWLFHLAVFTGHVHNNIGSYVMAAAAMAPFVDGLTTEYQDIKANVQAFLKAAGVLLDVSDPTMLDTGGMPEGQGYGRGSMDYFQTTRFAMANLLGIDYAAHPRLRGYAETVPLVWPTALSYFRGVGDDHAGKWSDVAELVGLRVGGLVQTARSLATSGNTPTTAEATRNPHVFLSATPEPSASGWPVVTMAYHEHGASHWSDIANVNRSGFVLHAQPFWSWNHTWAAPLGEYVEHRGQHLVIPASVYDSINTEHQKREGGLSQSYPGVVSIDGRTASTKAPKGANRFRAVRSDIRWRAASEAKGVQVVVRDAGQSYGMVPAKAVAGGGNVGNGYVFFLSSEANAREETWTLTCTNAGTGTFSCTGSVSLAQGSWAANGGVNVNAYLSGAIQQGSTPFAVGDTFTVQVRNITKMVGTDITIKGVIKLAHIDAARATAGAWERNLPTNDVQTPTSLVVSGGNTLTANHAAGHGLPVGATVNADITGVTSQGGANAVWPGTVRDSNNVDFVVSGLTNGTLTGTAAMAVNYSPATLAGVLYIGNKMRAGGARGTGTVTPLMAGGTVTTSLVGWEHGDASLDNQFGNASTHELGSISYRDPRRRVWKNTLNFPSGATCFGFTHLWLLAGATLTSFSTSTSGLAGARVSTANISYMGSIYTLTKTEGVIDPVLTVSSFSPDLAAPVNTVAPSIAHTPGELGLAVLVGAWAGVSEYTYQWCRDGVDVPDGLDSTYTISEGDADALWSCIVTGTNSAGSLSVTAPAVTAPGGA